MLFLLFAFFLCNGLKSVATVFIEATPLFVL
jgi:hypothetical protein